MKTQSRVMMTDKCIRPSFCSIMRLESSMCRFSPEVVGSETACCRCSWLLINAVLAAAGVVVDDSCCPLTVSMQVEVILEATSCIDSLFKLHACELCCNDSATSASSRAAPFSIFPLKTGNLILALPTTR